MQNYLVTVEIIPGYPRDRQPFIDTILVNSPTANKDDIEENLAGFDDSPIYQLMNTHDLEVVDNFSVIRIEDIEKPNTNKQPKIATTGITKRYDEIYGYWITHEGELIPVIDTCGHTKINTDGYKDGWIAVITQNEHDLSFRFFEHDVTKEALTTLLEIIRKSNYPVYHCDFGLNDDIFSKTTPSKVEVNKKIKELIATK